MKTTSTITLLVFLLLISLISNAQKPDYALVIHGGAGWIVKERYTPDQEKQYLETLEKALAVGDSVLKNNGTATDAVVAVISLMEECPLFNAGKGAVLTHDGSIELDASIMDGGTKNAGAVTGLRTVKSPIKAARMVMDSSVHVMMMGDGATGFAKKMGLEIVDSSYFYTEESKKQLKVIQDKKHGTVGCVAMDKNGNLAAGTSTGGMSNKQWGRIGDSPIIGAGTYADNSTCAISCTGHGEFFIRNVVAYDIAARMKYNKQPLDSAANTVINKILKDQNASGGLIAIDKDGNISMPFNTPGMFRGYLKAGEKPVVLMYKE